MSFIATSDFQCEFNNIDLCEQAWQEVLHICKKRNIKTIAYLGDGKESYNPVDVRVIHWWQNAIHRAIQKKITVLYLLGNHDRVGQSADSDNWLPILKRAGAIVFDKPGITSDGERKLYMLPYSGPLKAKENIKKLIKERKPDSSKDVLFFHHELRGIFFNRYGSISDASLNLIDICSNGFRFCIGGHVHFPQRFGEKKNTYYVGSPFCTDWGECNQRKRYLVVREDSIVSVHSRIPRWYDPSINGFSVSKPSSWNGARVRISVSCDASEDYGRRLEKVKRDAEKKYRGAIIYVVPKFIEREADEQCQIKTTDSDERKIREYCKHSSARLVGSSREVIDYMLEKLSHFSGGLRAGSKVKFLWAKGKNFLPFEKIKTDFTRKGITVIQGVNHDRGDKSNGSGKTSCVQSIPVCLFGKTFKDQSHDGWATRGSHGSAQVVAALRDYKKREIIITRGRRPPLLRMLVDGKDVSSGMKSNERTGTQAQIEQVTGFTWQTLANAVYIDRAISDAFLSGTKKQRTDVLSRFQNLERFEKALQLVKKDERKNHERLLDVGEKLSATRASIKECAESVESLKALSKVQIEDAYKEYSIRSKAKAQWKKKNTERFKKLEDKAIKLADGYNVARDLLFKKEKELVKGKTIVDRDEKYALKVYKLGKKKKCPTCHQKVSKEWLCIESANADATYQANSMALRMVEGHVTELRKKVQLLDGEHTEVQRQIGRLDNELRTLTGAKQTAQEQWMELASDKHTSQGIINKTKQKLQKLIETKTYLKKKIKKYRKLNALYEYAVQAFSRNGIPQFLNKQLCPILNQAADYYADLFSDREIQLRFEADEEGFVPKIINTKGGAEIEDQSEGERALAGLIASFALREAAPKCNILILDEPGAGLDMQTAKQFARALQVLKKRFGSIWITSHNVHILSELANERTITVVKKNRISTIQES